MKQNEIEKKKLELKEIEEKEKLEKELKEKYSFSTFLKNQEIQKKNKIKDVDHDPDDYLEQFDLSQEDSFDLNSKKSSSDSNKNSSNSQKILSNKNSNNNKTNIENIKEKNPQINKNSNNNTSNIISKEKSQSNDLIGEEEDLFDIDDVLSFDINQNKSKNVKTEKKIETNMDDSFDIFNDDLNNLNTFKKVVLKNENKNYNIDDLDLEDF
jgi:hypothetical protein